MALSYALDGQKFSLGQPQDVSIPIRFDATISAFSLPLPKVEECYSLSKGNSVNCCTLSITPHGNGTHTECIAHISNSFHKSIIPILTNIPPLMVGWIVAVIGTGDTSETGPSKRQSTDILVTVTELQRLWTNLQHPFKDHVKAVFLQMPVTHHEKYLTKEAAQFLSSLGINHLLLTTNSADREDDGGELIVHKVWFESNPTVNTITEICARVSDSNNVAMLSLNLTGIETDAVPSRPVLYPIIFN